MLSILIDDNSEEIRSLAKEYKSNVSDYFDLVFDSDWLKDDYVKHLILKIDNTVVNDDGTLYNEHLGGIVPSRLSSGVKGLILLYKTDYKINGDRLGDNCWGSVFDIADKKDISIVLRHIPRFPSDFSAYLINEKRVINRVDYILSFAMLVG